MKWQDSEINHPTYDISPDVVSKFVSINKFSSNDVKYQPHFRDSLLTQLGIDPKSVHILRCNDMPSLQRNKCLQSPKDESNSYLSQDTSLSHEKASDKTFSNTDKIGSIQKTDNKIQKKRKTKNKRSKTKRTRHASEYRWAKIKWCVYFICSFVMPEHLRP